MGAPQAGLTSIETVSRDLFGAKLFVSVSAVIVRGNGDFTQSEIAGALGVSDSSVQGCLNPMARAGLIERLPVRRGEKLRWLRRRPSAFWDFVVELVSRPELETPVHVGSSADQDTLF